MHQDFLIALLTCVLASYAIDDVPSDAVIIGTSALLQQATATSTPCASSVGTDGSLCCIPSERNKFSHDSKVAGCSCKCGFLVGASAERFQRVAKPGDVLTYKTKNWFFKEEKEGKYVFEKWEPAPDKEPTSAEDESASEGGAGSGRKTETITAKQMESVVLDPYCEALAKLETLPAEISEFKQGIQDCTNELEEQYDDLKMLYGDHDRHAQNVKAKVEALQPHLRELASDKSAKVFQVAKELRDHELQTVRETRQELDNAYKEVEKEYAVDDVTEVPPNSPSHN